ncbi:hypothetical protein [Leptospira sp. GIMC2001]|uniref:hypothetical protein n=1 Tax=Leptospira sp. GIMC2001 TaxID=1513297 RepID=UPI00234B9F15|nr:hypothetical protein [Leptospira sp. GIMC2001]WCL48665.1 hypothetical protein O4O04_15330 [Leptospira sp. GIMC2001]
MCSRFRKIQGYLKFFRIALSIIGIQVFLPGCMAWPGFTAVISGLQSSASSAMMLFPLPGSGEQPQDNPVSSDDPNSILDPETETIPIFPNTITPQLIVTDRTGNLVSESGTKKIIKLRLSAKPEQSVTFSDLVLSKTGEITLSQSFFLFTPSNWDIDQNLEVTGIADDIQDGNQEVILNLGASISLDPNFQAINGGEVFVTNTDIDTVGITISPVNGLVTSESGSTTMVQVVLNSKPLSNVTIPLNNSNPSEVMAGVASVSFTPSNWNTPQNILLTGQDDISQDGNQSFTIQLGPSSSGDLLYQDLYSGIANGINTDNDTASIVVTTSATAPYILSESGTTIDFKVRLSSQPTHTVTIPVFSLNPSEGRPSISSLVFTSANWNVEQNLIVTGWDEDDIDGDKLFSIQLDTPTSLDSNYSSLLPININFTNLDNDVAGLVFQNHTGMTTSEDGTNLIFRMKLRSKPTSNVTINLSSSDISEGTLPVSSFTFTPANWNSFRNVPVLSVNDSLIDGDILYQIQFDSITSADTNYNNLIVSSLGITNLDDDTPGVLFYGANSITTIESSSTAVKFQIRLKTKPTSNVRFPLIISSNLEEGTVTPAVIEFSPTDWNVPRDISIQSVRDYIQDSNQLYSIDFSNLESLDPLYDGLSVASVSVTNQNSDTRGYITIPTYNSINMMVTDSGRTDSFTIRLNSKPTGNVVIPISSLLLSEMTVSPASIEFTPSDWNVPQVITVAGIEDGILDSTASRLVGLRLGAWNSGLNRYYPLGSSDYSDFAFTDRNGSTSDNGVFNVRSWDTFRLVNIIHPTSPSIYVTSEAGGKIFLEFTLGKVPTSNVTIHISSTNPSEGIPNFNSIVFTPSDWNDLKVVEIIGQDDSIIDGNVNYQLVFSVESADLDYHLLPINPYNFRNNDNDNNGYIVSPSNSSSNPFITTRKPGLKNSVSFSLRLRAIPEHSVTIPLVSNNPSQSTLDKSVLVFDSTNWNVPQDVMLTALDDLNTNIVNYGIVVGGSNISADPKFSPGATLTVFIRNTSPGFTVGTASGLTGEWGLRASSTIRLNSPPASTVNFYYYIDNESEGKSITGSVNGSFPIPNVVRTFTRTTSNWNSNQTIAVEGVDDELLDGNQNFRIVFLPTSSADPDYDGLVPNSIEFTNQDND